VEGITRDVKEYRTLLPKLIENWRKDFSQGDFTFIFVQLAHYLKLDNKPSKSRWAMLRKAQSQTLKLLKTGMAMIIYIGEENDIHPRNKKDLGYRLS
jgi:sialate O-acetylesterase